MTIEDGHHSDIADRSTEMESARTAKQTTEMDLSASMVYVRDVERDANSSSSTYRVDCESTRRQLYLSRCLIDHLPVHSHRIATGTI